MLLLTVTKKTNSTHFIISSGTLNPTITYLLNCFWYQFI